MCDCGSNYDFGLENLEKNIISKTNDTAKDYAKNPEWDIWMSYLGESRWSFLPSLTLTYTFRNRVGVLMGANSQGIPEDVY